MEVSCRIRTLGASVANLLLSMLAKKIENRLIFGGSYGQEFSVLFFLTHGVVGHTHLFTRAGGRLSMLFSYNTCNRRQLNNIQSKGRAICLRYVCVSKDSL